MTSLTYDQIVPRQVVEQIRDVSLWITHPIRLSLPDRARGGEKGFSDIRVTEIDGHSASQLHEDTKGRLLKDLLLRHRPSWPFLWFYRPAFV
jgi:hypothetical protein